MDVDYIAGMKAIDKLKHLFFNLEHGEREEMADDIITFVSEMEVKIQTKNHELQNRIPDKS